MQVTIKASRLKGPNATPCLQNNPAHDGTEWETWWGVIGYPGRDRQRGGEVCPQSCSHTPRRLRSRVHAYVRTHASLDSVCGGRQVDAVLDLKKVVLGEKGEDEMVLKFWAPKRRPKETVRLRGHTGCTSPERLNTAAPAHAHSCVLEGSQASTVALLWPTGVCFRTRAARDEPLLHWL